VVHQNAEVRGIQYIKVCLERFMDLPALACTSNLHYPHQDKNQSSNAYKQEMSLKTTNGVGLKKEKSTYT